jgi:hypothetical protein
VQQGKKLQKCAQSPQKSAKNVALMWILCNNLNIIFQKLAFWTKYAVTEHFLQTASTADFNAEILRLETKMAVSAIEKR